jgi:predicted RNA-binding protein associated with RNAse of E/G family
MEGHDLVYDFKLIEGTPPKAGKAAVLFIDVLGFWRRNIRRVAIVGTAATVATVGAAEASAAQANAAAAQANASAAAARAAAAPTQSAATKKLEQLKSLLNEGLITQAQYQKASQQVLNEVVN